jgi:hypothetical protein
MVQYLETVPRLGGTCCACLHGAPGARKGVGMDRDRRLSLPPHLFEGVGLCLMPVPDARA